LHFLLLYLTILSCLTLFAMVCNGVMNFIHILIKMQYTIRQKRQACIAAIHREDFHVMAKRLEELWFAEAQLRNPLWLISRLVYHAIAEPFLRTSDVVYRWVARGEHSSKSK
jgi:hypothetical protein